MFIPYVIGCITATLMLPIVVLKVYGFRWTIAIPLMLLSIPLLMWSWLTVFYFVYQSSVKWHTLEKYKEATAHEPC